MTTIRDLQSVAAPKSNTPCKHTPLKGAHCFACPPARESAAKRKAKSRAALKVV